MSPPLKKQWIPLFYQDDGRNYCYICDESVGESTAAYHLANEKKKELMHTDPHRSAVVQIVDRRVLIQIEVPADA